VRYVTPTLQSGPY